VLLELLRRRLDFALHRDSDDFYFGHAAAGWRA